MSLSLIVDRINEMLAEEQFTIEDILLGLQIAYQIKASKTKMLEELDSPQGETS